MTLSLEQIRAATLGAERVDEQEGWIRFLRFSREEAEVYRVQNEFFHTKTFATAGIRLDFRTDASAFSFAWRCVRASSRENWGLDLYVDGVFTQCLQYPRVEAGTNADEGEARFPLPPGEKRVTLYLSNHFQILLKDVTLEDAAVFTPVPASMRILCYGDSITQGYVCTAPSLSYANRLAVIRGAEVCNKAIAGENFNPAFAAAANRCDPDIVTVAYGINDWHGCSREEFLENAHGFFRALAPRYPRAEFYVLTPIWCGAADTVKHGMTFGEMEEIVRNAAAQLPRLTILDGLRLMPHLRQFFKSDAVHPIDEGHLWYGEQVIRAIFQKNT